MKIFKNSNSRKHDLVVTSIEVIKDATKTKHTRLVECYVAGECNNWAYSLELASIQLRFWKPLENDEFEVDYIDLALIDNNGNVKSYVEKIEFDGKEIFNMKDYEFKTYLYRDEEDNTYYIDDYLAPKDPILFPNETKAIISKLREAGHLVDTDEIFKKMTEIADRYYDGHFTLMKFTTNWKCGFTTPNDWLDIQELCTGKTQDQAMILAIQKHYLEWEDGDENR